MKAFVSGFCLLGCPLIVAADSNGLFPIPVAEWIAVDVPDNRSLADKVVFSDAALNSEMCWEVLIHDSVVAAKKAGESGGRASRTQLPFDVSLGRFDNPLEILQVDDGWLVGDHEGEFGGALYWFSSDGKSRYKISDHQVEGFVRILGVVCVLEGLSHRMMSVGSMVCLERDLKWRRWRAHEVAKLPADPLAWVVGPHSELYVFTGAGLVMIEDLKDVKVIWEGKDFLLKFANSMVMTPDRAALYVGFHQYVGRYVFKTGKFDFLVPDLEMIHRLTPEREKELRESYRDGD